MEKNHILGWGENLMTIYKKGTKKYKTANKIYGKKKAKKLNKYQRIKSNFTKWVYGRLGRL